MSKERTLDERVEDDFSRMYRHTPSYILPVVGDGILAYDLIRNKDMGFNKMDKALLYTAILCTKYSMFYRLYITLGGPQ